MDIEPESLVAELITHIACSWNGCTVDDIVAHARTLLVNSSRPRAFAGLASDTRPNADQAFAKTVWEWLVSRSDVFVGQNGEWNHMRLEEVFSLASRHDSATAHEPLDTAEAGDDQTLGQYASGVRTVSLPALPKLFVSESKVWESIAGHEVDYQRVPKSQWDALLGIASSGKDGIIQGDLRKLVGQDKRSLPHRTDLLAQRGYVVKRTTLIKGCKTSKIWLKRFAPDLPRNSVDPDTSDPSNDITCEDLTSSTTPVTWHTRWTNGPMDLVTLGKTIIAILKAWRIMRFSDLKAKLGVKGRSWEMRVVARSCRFFAVRGCIKYVVAAWGNRVLRDCVKYVKDLGPEDWAAFLCTGLSPFKPQHRPAHSLLAVKFDYEVDPPVGGSCSSRSRPGDDIVRLSWCPDEPLSLTISNLVRMAGTEGLSTPEIVDFTFGWTFRRYVSTLSTVLASMPPLTQQLNHLCISRELRRVGKAAVFKFFAAHDAGTAETHATQAVGCQPVTQHARCHSLATIESGFGFGSVQVPDHRAAQELMDTVASITSHPRAGEPLPGNNFTMKHIHKGPAHSTITEGRVTTPHAPERIGLNGVIGRGRGRRTIGSTSEGNYRCDKCGNAWKNDVGLKYHLTKARTRCNPSWMVNMQPAPSRGQKHEFEHIPEHTCVTETIERSKIAEQPQSSTSQSATNRRKQDVTGRKVDCQSRKRESPNRSVTPDSQMFDVMYDGSNSSSAGVSHKTQTTKFSHDKTSMIADYSTTECDPLPPVIGNDVLALTTYTSSHVTGNGAYPSAMSMVPTIPSHSATELDVRSQEAGPIFVLRDTFAFNDITNVVDGKAIAMATPNALTKHHSLDAAAIAPRNHQTMPPPHAKHIPFPMPVFESGKRRTAEQVVSSRITAIMVWLIDCMGGLFPAGQSLWFACRIIWRHYFNPDPCPTDERFGAQLDNLVMKKLLRVFPAEISCTDSTKAQDNTTATGFMVARDGCDIINRSHVRDIMVAVRKAHPFPYIPEVILTNLPTMTIPTEDPILTFTGRRMIIGRIESLDAPFYARDSGKVRQPSMSPYTIGASRLRLKDNLANLSSSYEPLGNATDRSSSLSRSGQKLCRVERGCLDQDTPVVLNSGNRRSCLTPALVHAADETGIRGNFPITTESGSWRTTRPPPDIQIGFLMPNMYLDKQFAPQEEMALVAKLQTTPTVSQSTDQTSIINELLPQTTSMAWKCPRLLFSPTQILRPISDKHRDHHHVPALKWFEENDQSYLVDVWAPDRTWLNLEAFPSRARRLYSTRSSSHGRNSAAFSASYENFLDNVAAIHEVEMTPSYFPPVIPTCSLPYRIFVPLNGPGQHSLGDTLCELDWDRGVHLNLESSRMLYENSGPPQDDNDNSDWAPEPMGRKRRRVTAVRDKGLNREGSLRGWRSRAPARETLKHRYMTSISQPIEAHMCTSEVTPQPRTDETLATTATANRKRCHVPLSSDHFTAHDRDDVLLTAFVVVRALLGGTNEAIDWGFMLYLFPHMSVHALRQHWVRYRKYRSVYIARLTARFQSEFIRTYEQDEIPILNFDDIHGYDWEGLIRWTMSIRVEEDVKLPASRHMLITNNPPPNEVVNTSDDPQERFFHPQSSVFSRLEAATSEPAALPLWTPHTSHSALQLVRSFVKALSGTPAKRYPISDIRTRFAPFRGYGNPGAELLDRAVNQLTAQKTICKSSKARLHGPHPFRLSELFYHTLTKLGQADKYTEASRFKQELDGAALQHAKLRLPYTVQDGATLAYINLQAHQRVALQPTSVPQIPLGFEPGKYETRKFSKRYYHFGLEIVPTTDYVMSNAIAMLGVARQEPPPLFGPNGEIPVWCDIFGILDRHRWANLIGGFLFLISTRGSLPIPGMCKAMKPLVDEFEIDLMTGWAKKVGVLRSNPLGVGLVLSEWWWLMVPSLYSDDNVS